MCVCVAWCGCKVLEGEGLLRVTLLVERSGFFGEIVIGEIDVGQFFEDLWISC